MPGLFPFMIGSWDLHLRAEKKPAKTIDSMAFFAATVSLTCRVLRQFIGWIVFLVSISLNVYM
jgi:hypothetical protein